MGGGGWHSVPTKEDFKAAVKKDLLVTLPLALMAVSMVLVFMLIFSSAAYYMWTNDYSSLPQVVSIIGKLLATVFGLLTWLLASGLARLINAFWRK